MIEMTKTTQKNNHPAVQIKWSPCQGHFKKDHFKLIKNICILCSRRGYGYKNLQLLYHQKSGRFLNSTRVRKQYMDKHFMDECKWLIDEHLVRCVMQHEMSGGGS